VKKTAADGRRICLLLKQLLLEKQVFERIEERGENKHNWDEHWDDEGWLTFFSWNHSKEIL
jgi:hypothetical protein